MPIDTLKPGEQLSALSPRQPNLVGRQTDDAPLEVTHLDGFDFSSARADLQLDRPFHRSAPSRSASGQSFTLRAGQTSVFRLPRGRDPQFGI